jgi:hypothetical protein
MWLGVSVCMQSEQPSIFPEAGPNSIHVDPRTVVYMSRCHVFRNAGRAAQHNCRRWFDAPVKAAGIAEYSWHCNRRPFIRRPVMAGVDMR